MTAAPEPPPHRALRYARGAALALLVSLPLQAWPLANVAGQGIVPADLLLMAAWLLGGVAVLAPPRARPRPEAMYILGAGLAFLAALLLSLLVNGGPRSSFLKLAALTPMVLSPALFTQLFADEASALRACKALAIGGLVALGFAVVTVASFYIRPDFTRETLMCGYGALASANYPRLCAPFRNPNSYANFLVATVPLLLAGVAAWRGRWAAFAAAALAFAAAVFTLSAGLGALAIAIAATVGAAWGGRRRRSGVVWLVWAGALAVELVFVLASLGTLVPRGSGDFGVGARDYLFWDGSRPSILTADWATFSAHPLFGIGYGARVAHVTDPRAFVPADKLLLPHADAVDMEAHNLLFSVGGQAGLVGLVVFVVLLVQLVRPLLSRRERLIDDVPRMALLAAFAGVVIIHGVFIANEEGRHFWAFLGVLHAMGLAWLAPRQAGATSEPAGDS